MGSEWHRQKCRAGRDREQYPVDVPGRGSLLIGRPKIPAKPESRQQGDRGDPVKIDGEISQKGQNGRHHRNRPGGRRYRGFSIICRNCFVDHLVVGMRRSC